MTKIQLKFLKALNKKNMTSIELCKELKIAPIKNDVGGYYNALNQRIGYLTSEECEIEDFFTVSFDNQCTKLGDELYQITPAGKQFLDNHKKSHFEKHTTIWGIIIALLSLIVAIIALF